MYLCITGFLPDSFQDSSLKYEFDVDATFNGQILSLLSHKSLNDMASGEWLLKPEQARQIAALINEPIPLNLDIFIGVES